MLLRAVETNKIPISKQHSDTASCQLSRESLKRYARAINDQPRFLFDIGDKHERENGGYIDFADACRRAYEETEETIVAKAAELPLPGGSRSVLSWYAYAIVGKGHDIPIFGKRPPSKIRRQISRQDLRECYFSDDARSLMRHNEAEPRFVELEIKKLDFEQRLEVIKSWDVVDGAR